MATRIFSAIILVALFLGIISIGEIGIISIAFLVNIIGLYEYINVVDKSENKYELPKLIYILLGNIPLILALIDYNLIIPTLPIILCLIVMTNILSKKYNSDATIYSVFGIIYVPLILSSMLTLIAKLGYSKALALIIFGIAVAVITDTFAYFFGIKFGKHRLCPEISPKKSKEGSVAGFIFGVICSVVLYIIYSNFNIIELSLMDMVIMGIINSILCQFGDLTASMVKRNFDVKDYGNLIPGHGGVLDRIDGILFSLAGTFFYVTVILNMLTL